MLKRSILTILFFTAVLLAVTPAGATTTRDRGLGLDALPWMVDGLQGHAYDNPSFLSEFRNVAFFEHEGIDKDEMREYGGIILSPLNNLYVALIGGLPVNADVWNGDDYEGFFHMGNYDIKSAKYPYTDIATVYPTADPLERYRITLSNGDTIDLNDPESTGRKDLKARYVNLLSAYDFGRWAIGVNFGYAASWKDKSYDSTTANTKESYLFSNAEYDIGVGGVFRINSAMSVDGNIKATIYQLENTYDGNRAGTEILANYESDNAMDIEAAVRYNLAMTKSNKMHVRVGYTFINHSTQGGLYYKDAAVGSDPDASETFKRMGQLISLGVSDEIRFSEKVIAFAGLNAELKLFTSDYSGYDYFRPERDDDSFKSERTTLNVPIVLGAEAMISDNWTGRFGVKYTLINTVTDKISNVTDSASDKYDDTTKDNNSSNTSINIGLSYKLGNFRLDWLANIDLFVKGPDFISGDSNRLKSLNMQEDYDGVPLSMAFAATYSFDNLFRGEQTENMNLAPDAGKAADKAGKPKI